MAEEWPPARIDAGAALVRHREGDPEAFAVVVELYRRPVYSYLIRCGVRPEDRDDLFQAVFLRVHRSASDYQAEKPAHPWIFTIVVNEVRTHFRRRRVRELVFGAPPAPEPRDARPDAERAAAAREGLTWLVDQLPSLPMAQREVLLLAGVEGLPLAHIGDVLGLPVNSVKTHLRRARLELCRRMAAGGRRP